MRTSEVLAYLAGIVDGDGCLKVTKSLARSNGEHPYYGITVGVQQLAPGEAVQLFAATFGGELMPPVNLPGRRPIARCEIHTPKAEAAARRLLPYLLVKRNQALLLLEVGRICSQTNRRSRERFDRLEAIRRSLLSMHDGHPRHPGSPRPTHDILQGYELLGPPEMGWTRHEVHAYLAGIMDSDGSFRVETRGARGMIHLHYRINIRCAQVAPSPAIELLAIAFGGNLGFRQDRRPNARNLITWSLHDRAAVPAIKALLPYLIVKKTEAWLLLELRRLKEEGKKGTTKWEHPNRRHNRVKMRKRCYTPGQVASFERIHRAIQDLHSGRHAEPSWPSLAATKAARSKI